MKLKSYHHLAQVFKAFICFYLCASVAKIKYVA